MTTIVAVIKDGTIAMAADGRVDAGDCTVSLHTRKIMHWGGGLIIGQSGELRARDIVEALDLDDGLSAEEVWQKIRTAFLLDGFVFANPPDAQWGSPGCGCSFIFAIGATLWRVTGDGGMVACAEGEPCAIGAGSPEAIGAMVALIGYSPAMTAKNTVIAAVEIVKRYDASTDGGTYVATREASGSDVAVHWVRGHES